jgi:hypothetical protein
MAQALAVCTFSDVSQSMLTIKSCLQLMMLRWQALVALYLASIVLVSRAEMGEVEELDAG